MSPPTPDRRRPDALERIRGGRAVVALLALLAVVVLSQLYGTLVLAGAAAAELGAEPGAAGYVQAAFGIAYAVGVVAWGPAVDRVGARRVMLIGLAVLVAATVIVATAPGFAWLLGGRLAQGVAAASFAPAAFAYLGTHLPAPARTAAITVLTSSFLASAVLGQAAAQAVTAVLSWRWFFGVGAIVLASAGGAAAVVLRGDATAGPASERPFAGLIRLLGRGRIVALLVATLAVLGPFVALYAAFGQTERFSAESLFLLRLSAFPALLWAGFAADRLGRLDPGLRLVVGFGGAALACSVLVVAGGTVIGAGAGMFVLAAGVALLAPAMVQALTALAPDRRGSITALYTCALFLGASLAPLLVEAIPARPGADPSVAVAAVAAPILLGAAILSRRACRPHR